MALPIMGPIIYGFKVSDINASKNRAKFKSLYFKNLINQKFKLNNFKKKVLDKRYDDTCRTVCPSSV